MYFISRNVEETGGGVGRPKLWHVKKENPTTSTLNATAGKARNLGEHVVGQSARGTHEYTLLADYTLLTGTLYTLPTGTDYTLLTGTYYTLLTETNHTLPTVLTV